MFTLEPGSLGEWWIGAGTARKNRLGLGHVVRQAGTFCATGAWVVPGGITLREYIPADRDACVALYSLNEVGRFPPGFLPQFEQTLDRADYLKLVLCSGSQVVATGAIGRFPGMLGLLPQVWLVFGMMHPQFHRLGLGTVLMLARVAALPEPLESTKLLLSNVATSESFVSRFGFQYQGHMAEFANSEYRVGVCRPQFCVNAL